jgi:hypothetical protein
MLPYKENSDMADVKPISQLVNELPEKNVTTHILRALDFVVPGEWINRTNFDQMVRGITGEHDPATIRTIAERVEQLYADPSTGYQRAIWLYQTIDKTDAALGAAAMANLVGGRIGFLGFLNRITPKPDMAQTIDLSMKLAVEVIAFGMLSGISVDNIKEFDFQGHMSKYSGESAMRLAALICLDGIIPFGPDFTRVVTQMLDSAKTADLAQNDTFKAVGNFIPGQDAESKVNFVQQLIGSASGYIDNFIESRGLTREQVFSSIQKYVDVTDDKLDYVAAFLDMSTDYFRHTGTQTVAARLIERVTN